MRQDAPVGLARLQSRRAARRALRQVDGQVAPVWTARVRNSSSSSRNECEGRGILEPVERRACRVLARCEDEFFEPEWVDDS